MYCFRLALFFVILFSANYLVLLDVLVWQHTDYHTCFDLVLVGLLAWLSELVVSGWLNWLYLVV